MYTIWKSILMLFQVLLFLVWCIVSGFVKNVPEICQGICHYLFQREKETQEFKVDDKEDEQNVNKVREEESEEEEETRDDDKEDEYQETQNDGHDENGSRIEALDYSLSEKNHRNWLDLPDEVTAIIFSQLDPLEILKRAPKVCTTWRRICKQKLITFPTIQIQNFGSDLLLNYITNSCKGIKRLSIVASKVTPKGLSEVALELPLLEDLEISFWGHASVCRDRHALSYCTDRFFGLEVIGRCCPLLKSLKLNTFPYRFHHRKTRNHDAFAIGDTMPGLHHLQLIGNRLTLEGVRHIVKGCPRLESLDMRECYELYGPHSAKTKTVCERIHTLLLPSDPINDYEHLDIYCRIQKEYDDDNGILTC